jgi:SIR2-like domain
VARHVVIFGAGASFATHRAPLTATALQTWTHSIDKEHKLLGLALDWTVPGWRNARVNLETAWRTIDLAWNERQMMGIRQSVEPLDAAQRLRVWQLARAEQDRERAEPFYYRTQIAGARRDQWSTEQFLSAAAGWELRRLIQEKLAICRNPSWSTPYVRVLGALGLDSRDSVVSFNYDTLVEQCLDRDHKHWTYDIQSGLRRIAVLKPHGSVNWTQVIDGKGDHIRLGLQLPPRRMGYKGGRLIQNLVVGLRDKTEHTQAESSDKVRSHFQVILDACEAALRTSRRLFVVGYSFPRADTTFLDVVTKASASRPAGSLSLTIISKGYLTPGLSYIRDLFGPAINEPVVYCPHGFDAWKTHHPCESRRKA